MNIYEPFNVLSIPLKSKHETQLTECMSDYLASDTVDRYVDYSQYNPSQEVYLNLF